MAKKYIDATLLKEMIQPEYNRNKALFKKTGERYTEGIVYGLDMAEQFIDSLQQEQSCDTCTNDKGCVTCKDGELWEGKEQPSEELEAEIEMEWDSFNKHLAEYDGESEKVVWLNWFSFVDIANYFYELGKQAKEDLPEWKKAYAGTHFGEDVVTISPKGKDFPRVVETALTDCLYIPISELMKLAKKEE